MLIGLNGRKQAGKDTVYERVAHIMRDVVDVERVSFADLLYESAAASLGASVAQLREWKPDPEAFVIVRASSGEAFPPARIVAQQTVREYLQHYGTEAHRDLFGPDFWVDSVRGRLSDHHGRIVMVTDVRFENEAQAVHDADGTVVEVIGPMGRAPADSHASEAPLPEELIDATITNTVRDDGFRSLDRTLQTLLRLHLGEDAESYRHGVPVIVQGQAHTVLGRASDPVSAVMTSALDKEGIDPYGLLHRWELRDSGGKLVAPGESVGYVLEERPLPLYLSLRPGVGG